VDAGQPDAQFCYDSFKRLLSATNPESGTTCYGTVVSTVCQADGYDANGNLLYKTDARGILTTVAYDVLNRPTSKSYSGDGGIHSGRRILLRFSQRTSFGSANFYCRLQPSEDWWR